MNVILVDLPEDQRGLSDSTERLSQIISAINGYNGQGFRWNLVSYDDDGKYAQSLRNLGADGLHWAVYHSGSQPLVDDPIVEVQDAGLFVTDTDFRVYDGANVVLNVDAGGVAVGAGYPSTFGGNLNVTGTITATDDITSGGTLNADEGLDVIGGAIISGAITLNGTVEISSTLDVDGLATLVSGFDALDVSTVAANSAAPALIVQNTGSGALLTVQRFNGVSAVTVGSDGLLTAANNVSAPVLISTVPTGTPPLTVDSQTVVGNLNASFLEGKDSDAFSLIGHNHDSAYVNESGDSMSGDLTIGGELIVNGNVQLGNSTTDSVTVKGTFRAEEVSYLGTGASDQTVITGQVLFHGGESAGTFVAIPTNTSDPRLDWYDNSGDNVVSFNNSSSTFQLETYGNAYVSGELVVDGNVQLGNSNTDAVDIKGTLVVRDEASFEDPVLITDDVNLTGATLNLNAAYINFDLGSTAGASHSSWGGYITVKHNGNTVKIPYLTGAW